MNTEHSSKAISDTHGSIKDLLSDFNIEMQPFGIVEEKVLRGEIEGIELKQALLAHYRIFIADIWDRMTKWRETSLIGSENIGLILPTKNLRFINRAEKLFANDSSVPRSVSHFDSLLIPAKKSHIPALKQKLKKPEVTLITLLWSAAVFRWELQYISGEIKSESEYGIDLYKQCSDLLLQERLQHIEECINDGRISASQAANARRNTIIGAARANYQLSIIIGEAIETGIEVWQCLPKNRREIASRVAALPETIGVELLNHFISADRADGVADTTSHLKTAIAKTSANKDEVITRMQKDRYDSGNTSRDPIACGCPALGTPAFFGSMQLYDEVNALLSGNS